MTDVEPDVRRRTLPGAMTQEERLLEPGGSNQNQTEEFHDQLLEHLVTRSRGSSINLSFDLSSSSSSSDNESESPSEIFRDRLFNNPSHLRMYIKEKLRYHFMSPLEKWHYRRVFPWKLTFQIIKIFIVTIQILLFGMDNTQFYKEQAASLTALKVYFLKDWDSIRDVYFYPPTDGPYAVFTRKELFDSIDLIVQRYGSITDEMIGSFNYDSKNNTFVSPKLCFKYFKSVKLFPFNCTVTVDNQMERKCFEIFADDYSTFDIVDYMKKTNVTMDLDKVIEAKMDFTLRAKYRRRRTVYDYFVAYRMRTEIKFQNKLHDGLVEVELNVDSRPNRTEWISEEHRSIEMYARQCLNAFVILLCSISLGMCVRSIYRGFHLLKKTLEYFRTQALGLNLSDRSEFIDLWLCLIVINDVLVISGTSLKVSLDSQSIPKDRFIETSILLGTGLLLVWCGVIRYVGYFRTYNILIVTLKKSTPNLLKFLTCAIILFIGYTLCGWVVLGPHHQKFKTIATTMECLYAITNGDDIFATFALATNEYGVNEISESIWWFARIYLYTFVILFICVVINLLYAVIIDTYDTIKEISDADSSSSKGLIREFIGERLEHASSVNYLLDEELEGPMGTFEYLAYCFSWFRSSRNAYIDDTLQAVEEDD